MLSDKYTKINNILQTDIENSLTDAIQKRYQHIQVDRQMKTD